MKNNFSHFYAIFYLTQTPCKQIICFDFKNQNSVPSCTPRPLSWSSLHEFYKYIFTNNDFHGESVPLLRI